MSTLTYLKSFFKDKDVASVMPTSRFCVQKVCRPIDFSRDLIVIEYGAGTGVFSEYLLEHMTPGSRLVLFETNQLLFEKLQEIDDPRIQLLNESVEFVADLLDDTLVGTVDYIISGIPFSFLGKEMTMSILEQSLEILHPEGSFLAYQTTGHLKEPLRQVFGNVTTKWEWRNMPPLTTYQAVKR